MTARQMVWAVLCLLPASTTKNRLLRAAGAAVAKDAVFGPNLVLRCSQMTVARGSVIRSGNVFKGVDQLSIGEHAYIGSWNFFTAGAEFASTCGPAKLTVRASASITGRHYFDCSGGVSIGAFSTIAGLRSTILSHGIDVTENEQRALPVTIGDYCLVGSNCTILAGAALPARSVLAAGAVLVRVSDRAVVPAGLYAGVPARLKGSTEGGYFSRTERSVAPKS